MRNDETPGVDLPGAPNTSQLAPTSVSGKWPTAPLCDELLESYRRERARHEITFASVRAELEEQPSENLIRACARRWCADITALAESLTKATKSPEADE
ncbi:hypothetical protein [Streptomyces lydicus]|uniref:hypothetical protein n=1 Tax=Streptomyces lydicus TaxID=47763 RepID=UPI0037B06C71